MNRAELTGILDGVAETLIPLKQRLQALERERGITGHEQQQPRHSQPGRRWTDEERQLLKHVETLIMSRCSKVARNMEQKLANVEAENRALLRRLFQLERRAQR